MNKKLLSFLALSISSLVSFSQSVFEIKDTHTNAIVTNGLNIITTTTASTQSHYDLEVKNTSATSQVYTVKRFDDLLNTVGSGDAAAASFCTGSNCYVPATTTATFSLLPNETVILKADLEEASVVGLSDVRYRVYDTDNSMDAITFTLKYNGTVSVKNINNALTSVSDVYPNPSQGKTILNLVSTSNLSQVKLNILNSLGSVVSSKMLEINSGKNQINLETENLNSGLYFVTISQGNQQITKKITINK